MDGVMSDLTTDQRECWNANGYLIVKAFASSTLLESMLTSVRKLVRRVESGEDIRPILVQPETALLSADAPLENRTSKVFRVHREDEVFAGFAREPHLLSMVADLLGPDLDCFLSQFIFKHPSAIGQPWHQDAYYFPFDRTPQVGAWLAVTQATLENGPLWVLPGSHREPVHAVEPDPRPGANLGYVEIVDHDTRAEIPVLLDAGDLLLFHSHLFHRSTDNRSEGMRAAMVYHYAEGGTVDRSAEKLGYSAPNIDWMPVLRDRKSVPF
jgi:phytanoyl-CoA hydroxylase